MTEYSSSPGRRAMAAASMPYTGGTGKAKTRSCWRTLRGLSAIRESERWRPFFRWTGVPPVSAFSSCLMARRRGRRLPSRSQIRDAFSYADEVIVSEFQRQKEPHHLGQIKQIGPNPRDPCKQRPVTTVQPQTRRRPRGDVELMTDKQILGFKPASRLEDGGDEPSTRMQDHKHRSE